MLCSLSINIDAVIELSKPLEQVSSQNSTLSTYSNIWSPLLKNPYLKTILLDIAREEKHM